MCDIRVDFCCVIFGDSEDWDRKTDRQFVVIVVEEEIPWWETVPNSLELGEGARSTIDQFRPFVLSWASVLHSSLGLSRLVTCLDRKNLKLYLETGVVDIIKIFLAYIYDCT